MFADYFWKRSACLVLWPTEAKRLRSLGSWGEGAPGDPRSGKGPFCAGRRETTLTYLQLGSCLENAGEPDTCPASRGWDFKLQVPSSEN